jgi:hypothetical protein
MKIRLVTLTEDEVQNLAFNETVSDEKIIAFLVDKYLGDLGGRDSYPKTVEEFNALGTFEIEINDLVVIE